MTIKLPSGSYLLVEVKPDAHNFGIVPSLPKDYLYFDNNYGHDGTCEIQLPEGKWQLLGLAKDLSEEQWIKLFPFPAIIGGIYRYEKYDEVMSFCKTATESGLSLLKSHNLNPSTTLILKQIN